MRKSLKGQSTFEYIVMVAAALIVLIVFLNPGGPFRNSVEGILNDALVNQINDMTDSINFQGP